MKRYLAGLLAAILFSTSAQAVTLIGTSPSATNPQVAGAPATGYFWNPTAGTVSTSIGGDDIFDVSGTGTLTTGQVAANSTGATQGTAMNMLNRHDANLAGGAGRSFFFENASVATGAATSIDEGFFFEHLLTGAGSVNKEENGVHSYIQVDAGRTNSATIEQFESSFMNNGTVNFDAGNIMLQHNGVTGTIGSAVGYNNSLTNDNTTPGSVGQWTEFNCVPMSGAGTAPTHTYCLLNSDATAGIDTAGNMVIGKQSVVGTNTLTVFGTSTGTFPLIVADTSSNNLFFVRESGAGGFFAGTLQHGNTTTAGAAQFFNGSSGGSAILQANTATALASTISFPAISGSDIMTTNAATQTLTNKTLTAPTINGATIATSTVNGVTLSASGSATSYLDQTGSYSVPAGGGGGAVSSVSAADNTVVVTPTTGAVTVSAALNSQAGAASSPALELTGAPYTAGTGTTNYPLFYLNSGATQPTTLNAGGTMLGINMPSGFTGNAIDVRANGSGAALMSLNATGAVSFLATMGAAQVTTTNLTGNLFINAGFTNSNATTAGYQFAGGTNTGIRVGALGTNSTALTANSNYSAFNIGSSPVTTATTGTHNWLVGAVFNPIGTVTSGGAAITNTANVRISAPSSAGTNNYSLYVDGPVASSGALTASTVNGVSLTTGGSSSAFLNGSGTYTSPTVSIGALGTATPFTSSGTFTTAASSSTSTIYYYKMIAAGGGGGGANGALAAASAGGAGYYAEGTFTGVAASTAITITVGTGGVAGSATGGSGGSGGATTIGTPVLITAGGGGLGVGSTSATAGGLEGGAGGTLTSGTPNLVNVVGAHGGRSQGTSIITLGGNGGSSPLGSGGLGGQSSVALTPTAATGYGAGGGGAIGTTTAGGSGTGGFVEITQLTP